MGIARGELQVVSYKQETTFGTLATGNYETLWHNTINVTPQRQSFESQRALGDRQIGDMRLGRKSASGDIVSEAVYGNHDDLWAHVLQTTQNGPWTRIDCTAAAAFTAADGRLTDAAGTFAAVAAGEFVTVEGSANGSNNGMFKIQATDSDTYIQIAAAGILTDETVGTACKVRELDFVNGTTETSFTINCAYYDESGVVDRHDILGAVVPTCSLAVPSNGIATVTWSILAKGYDETGSTPTIVDTSLLDVDPFDGLGGTYAIAGLASTATMTSFNLTIDNGFTHTEPLGSAETTAAIPRKFRVSGSFTIYHEDATEIGRFVNETETKLAITLIDPDGNRMVFHLPYVQFTSAGAPKTDDGPIMEQISFTALKDPQSGKTIGIKKIIA